MSITEGALVIPPLKQGNQSTKNVAPRYLSWRPQPESSPPLDIGYSIGEKLFSAIKQQNSILLGAKNFNREVTERGLNNSSLQHPVLAAFQSESTQKTEIDPQWHFDDSLHPGVLEIHLIKVKGTWRKSNGER